MTAVLILAAFLVQQPTPPEKCTLSGTVVDSLTGLPLGKVEVVAEHIGGHDPGAFTTTDAKGAFLLVQVDPGQYRLAAKRNGYLDAYYGAKRSTGNGSTLTLTAGQKTEELQIKLTPFGVIAGTVRDSDGEPLAGAAVETFIVRYDAGRRRIRGGPDTTTDDLGQYRIANLVPGNYYVSATARSRDATVDHSAKSTNPPEVPILTLYPGTADPSVAHPVAVAAGARVTGIDIGLIRSHLYKISAHIDARPGLAVTASLGYSVPGFGGVGNSRRVNDKGDVEIVGVPPGSYIMRFSASEPAKPFDGTIRLFGGQGCEESAPISVGRSDVEGLRVAATGCAGVKGHISVEGEEQWKQPGGWVYVALDPGFGNDDNAAVKPDGSFEIHWPPGPHTIDFSGLIDERGLYVKNIRSGNQDVLHSGLNLGGSEQLDLEVVLAADGGQVEGVVSDADDKPVLGATVVLIPNDPTLRLRLDFTREAVTDQAGHFQLKSSAPGEYKLFAWNDIEKDSWLDPDVINDYEAKGERVTVKAKDPNDKSAAAQTVNLHVIP